MPHNLKMLPEEKVQLIQLYSMKEKHCSIKTDTTIKNNRKTAKPLQLSGFSYWYAVRDSNPRKSI